MARTTYRVRPGRGVSGMGFVVGLIFLVIGFAFILPNFGSIGWIWIAMVILITVAHAINAFSSQGIPTHEVEVHTTGDPTGPAGPFPAAPVAAPPAAAAYGTQTADTDSAEARLRQLDTLRTQNLISAAEYDTKRAEILREL